MPSETRELLALDKSEISGKLGGNGSISELLRISGKVGAVHRLMVVWKIFFDHVEDLILENWKTCVSIPGDLVHRLGAEHGRRVRFRTIFDDFRCFEVRLIWPAMSQTHHMWIN